MGTLWRSIALREQERSDPAGDITAPLHDHLSRRLLRAARGGLDETVLEHPQQEVGRVDDLGGLDRIVGLPVPVRARILERRDKAGVQGSGAFLLAGVLRWI